MIKSIIAPALSTALEKLKKIISSNEEQKKKTVIFCEDRLTLATERAVCAAVGGTFNSSVYTFSRFLASERGKSENVLSSQGSAMVIRRIIEENKSSLKLFGKFSASAAAAAVYDTIALLYASQITAEKLKEAETKGLLASKLEDISLIYTLYEEYLKKSGKVDRNKYLCELHEVIKESKKIKESEVIFFGFQSFTGSSSHCVQAAVETASSVYGIFIGGNQPIYSNEGLARFEEATAKALGRKVKNEPERAASTLTGEAELLRKTLFNPESYFNITPALTEKVRLYEATDEDEEMDFVAASIKRYVLDGVEETVDGAKVRKNIRFGNISVMVPDIAAAERRIERIFSQYGIPYYLDRRHPLIEHPVCDFILSYLLCRLTGCSSRDTDAVVSSTFFPVDRDAKDGYRNYALRLADFRGGIMMPPKPEILELKKFNINAVEEVRKYFIRGYDLLPVKQTKGEGEDEKKTVISVCPPDITAGIKELLNEFKVKEKLEDFKEKFKNSNPTASAFSGRVFEAVVSVLDEAENILGGGYLPLNEYIKILKSGFAAAEISLIPPKADAVFIGDIASTANTGSSILFALSLTEDVPKTSTDTSLLTDSEIDELGKKDFDISPKIRQVNLRRREQTALNICAFKDRLYLIYPTRQGGNDSAPSEILRYAKCVFGDSDEYGNIVNKKELSIRREKSNPKMIPYYCSEKLPALRNLYSNVKDAEIPAATVYSVLKDEGYEDEAVGALLSATVKDLSCGKELLIKEDKISPSSLESYFTCPYKNFMSNGLKLKEREEGTMRPLDTGYFIHEVLQNVSRDLKEDKTKDKIKDKTVDEVKERARREAEKLLKYKKYSSLTDTKAGQYTANELIDEAGKVAAGAFEQLKNSRFKILDAEKTFEFEIPGGVRIDGKIDRIDKYEKKGEDGERFVRIIDYKTGEIDSEMRSYYMGLKLQLPIYLNAASKGARAVGAYYFPAKVEYSSETNGVFRLEGFMDGSPEVVEASDTTLEEDGKSKYIAAAYKYRGPRPGGVIDKQFFSDFIGYSTLVAKQAVEEMKEGNITPSPANKSCKYCPMSGSCNFSPDVDGEGRSTRAVKSGEIAEIVSAERKKAAEESGRDASGEIKEGEAE